MAGQVFDRFAQALVASLRRHFAEAAQRLDVFKDDVGGGFGRADGGQPLFGEDFAAPHCHLAKIVNSVSTLLGEVDRRVAHAFHVFDKIQRIVVTGHGANLPARCRS